MRRDVIALGVLASLAGLGLSLEVIPYQIDDASIFYRYAMRIAAGLGPTFSNGDGPVEGFTSPAWMMLLTLGARLFGPSNLAAVATALGLLSTLGVIAMLTRMGGATGVSGLVSLPTSSPPGALIMLPVFAWACSPGATFYAVTGLETPLFVACVLAFHGALSGALPPIFGFVAGALALWIRPEGPWLVIAAGAQLLASQSVKTNGRFAVKLAVAVASGGALLLVVRLSVFDQWLPNTYFAKSPSWERGLSYLANALTTPWAVGLIGAASVAAVIGAPRERGLSLAALVWLLAAVVEGGDWMPAFRLLQPALVLAAAASTGLLTTKWRAVTLSFAAALALLVALEAHTSVTQSQTSQRSLLERRAEAKALVRWFQASQVHSVALVDIGELGVECPKAVLTDLGGLTDRTIARGAGSDLKKVIDLDYLFATRSPEVLVIRLRREPSRAPSGELAPTPPEAMSQREGDVLSDARLTTLYQPLFVFLPRVVREPLYARMVFVRRDVMLPQQAMFATDTVLMDLP